MRSNRRTFLKKAAATPLNTLLVGMALLVNMAGPRACAAVWEHSKYFSLHAQVIRFLEDHSRQFAH